MPANKHKEKETIVKDELNKSNDTAHTFAQTAKKMKAFLVITLIVIVALNTLFVFFTVMYFENAVEVRLKETRKEMESIVLSQITQEVRDSITQEILDEYARDNYLPDDFYSIGNYVYSNMHTAMVELICQNDTRTINATGIILNAEGYVLTNAHVVAYLETAVIGDENRYTQFETINAKVYNSNNQYEMAVIALDLDRDLAIIKFVSPPVNLSYCLFGSHKYLNIGEPIAAMGNNYGFGISVTSGELSGIHNFNNMQILYSDAIVLKGSSGGGFFNTYGELVGVISFALRVDGGVSREMGFAVCISEVIDFIDKIESDQDTIVEYHLSDGLPG